MVAASIYQLCGMSAPVFIDGHGVRKSDWKLEKTFYIHFFPVIFSLHVSLSNSELKFNLLFQYAISSLHVSLSLSLSNYPRNYLFRLHSLMFFYVIAPSLDYVLLSLYVAVILSRLLLCLSFCCLSFLLNSSLVLFKT